jgi:hypothetical protein
LRTEGDMVVGGTGMTIILGSSSTQIVTPLDGTASIVPTPGNAAGPCDLFIIVNAGSAAAQFDLQIVAAEEEDSRIRRFVQGAPPNGLRSGPGPLLFAVPEVISSGEPAVTSHVSACSDASADDAPHDQGVPASLSPAGRENFAAQPCARSKPVESKAREKPGVRVENEFNPTTAASLLGNRTPTPCSTRIPEDKRSCQVLAGDGILP